MSVSEAQKKASAKYLEKLDEIRIRMPKGKKDTIQAHAEAQGQSVNAYINTAINEKMSREGAEPPTTRAEGGEVSLPSGEGKRAPAASEERTDGIDPASADKLERE